MKSLGITGGIGAGKSECAVYLEGLGVPVLDTDLIARDLVEPGRPALAEIVATFGSGLIDADGRLDRSGLGRLVFADEGARRSLEAILHPRIFEVWTHWLDRRRLEGSAVAAVVIPLLYERDHAGHFDAVAALACSDLTQRKRLRARGWTDAVTDQRLAAQAPMADKLRRADYGLWTEGRVEVLHEQIRSVLRSVAA